MRVVAGIQPSGHVHLGNYFGSIEQNLALQAEAGDPADAFFFIADLHALTTVHDAAVLRGRTRDAALDTLALGLDPERATLFLQSDVPEVCELMWLLSCCTGKGLFERAHSYKDALAKGSSASLGLFSYPALMAADILAYDGAVVPVGKDQVQHVEMAQDMAQAFHAAFGREVFVRPEARLSGAPVVPGRDGAKMSKRYGNVIPVFPPEGMTSSEIYKSYFASITTDSRGRDEPKDPNDTLMVLLRLLDPERAAAIAPDYARGGLGYGELKRLLHEAYEARFAPRWERRREIARDEAFVAGVLDEGARRARAVARSVLARAREACGLPARHPNCFDQGEKGGAK